MANTKTVVSGVGPDGLYLVCDLSVTNINNDAGTGTLNYNLYVNSNDSTWAYIIHGRNHLDINGRCVWEMYDGAGKYENPYNMFVIYYRDDKETRWAQPPDYTFKGYKKEFGWVTSGSIPITYNDEGSTTISIFGEFQWYYSSGHWVYMSDSFTPDKIERYNKSQSTSDKGVNWSKNTYFWKTTDYGRNWTKVKGYKTTNNGNTWDKV